MAHGTHHECGTQPKCTKRLYFRGLYEMNWLLISHKSSVSHPIRRGVSGQGRLLYVDTTKVHRHVSNLHW